MRLTAVAMAVFGLVIAASGGCAVRTAADPSRLHAAPSVEFSEKIWPRRYAEPFEIASGDDAWTGVGPVPAIRNEEAAEALGRRVEVFDLGVCGGEETRGHLTCVMPMDRPGGGSLPWTRMYLYRSWTGPAGSGVTLTELGERFGDDARDAMAHNYGHITRLALFEPKGRVRGLVVHLTGLTGMHPERSVIGGLTEAGWAVLSVEPPNVGLRPSRHRVFHLISVNIVTEGMEEAAAGTIHPAEPVALVASIAEGAVSQYLAELAYAVEAGLDALAKDRPDLPQRPLALAGFSMGAIALPAVAARLEGRVDAAVLAGGGANVLLIARKSSLGVGLRASVDGRELTESELKAVERVYARLARLDPLNAADALTGVPVLMLHAKFDRIVPASAGELLYESLGKPERWTYPAGHLGLYWLLGTQADDIARWLGRAIGEDERAN